MKTSPLWLHRSVNKFDPIDFADYENVGDRAPDTNRANKYQCRGERL
jgi:hypothetical protein